jgi:hemolysin D
MSGDPSPTPPASAVVLHPFRKGGAGRPVKRGRDELSFLPAALEIIETPASPAGRATSLTIVAAALFAIAWASIGKVDVVVMSQGRIEPVGNSKTVQPLQVGVVQAILVENNQQVTAGQPLILLDPTDARADATRVAYDLQQARLDQSRLAGLRAAMLSGKPPVLANPPTDVSRAQLEATQAAMQAQYAGQVAKLADLDQQIAGQREKNGEAVATMAQLQASLQYAQQMSAVRDKAMTLGVGSKIDWITASQQLSQQQHQVAVLNMQEVEATSAQQALVAQRAQAVADYETSVLGDLVKAGQQIDQDQQDLAKAQEQLRLTALTAPITGTVQQLAVHTVGGVVTPAQTLLVVVPNHPKLTAEVRIKNEDIGFVHVGQAVQVKIAAFDFTRYGTIPGTITGISHDVEGAMPVEAPNPAETNPVQQSAGQASNSPQAQQDAQAGSYIAEISLGRTTINTDQGVVPLNSGMQLTADIKTSRRTLMGYLLSPLDMLKHNAMRQ